MRFTLRFSGDALRSLASAFTALCFVWNLQAQGKPSLLYYLPDIQYDPAIPTPAAWLGYEVGEWHVTHDQLTSYMRELARVSPRIRIAEYGRTHEHRPLLCLTITAPANHGRIEEIRANRRRLADPASGAKLDPSAFPAVAYMGYSIHGNEASGSNASLLVAYYLAAAQTPEVEQMLQQSVILLDPSFNPDGMQRFASWTNSRRGKTMNTDPQNDEFNEHWPGGRYNHYWFDLNRDWLVMQQPESGGRVRIFQDWLPNVLTDHHEMGSNATFFFQPGVPSRVNPITPLRNQELTSKISLYHAQLLSEKKILFYSRENYDDFYYGKGSTYPDANGSVGILFEQASSRGSAQETDNGVLTFAYSIRNQVLTSISTMRALRDMRAELNTYLRDFHAEALRDSKNDPVKAYVFGSSPQDPAEKSFRDLLLAHRIAVHPLEEDARVGGETFKKGEAFVVPVQQAKYRLIRGIFERTNSFTDSIFYDISAWTLPDAFGLKWAAAKSADFKEAWLKTAELRPEAAAIPSPPAPVQIDSVYAFVVGAEGYAYPKLLNKLLSEGVRVKVATKTFGAEGHTFAEGALLITVEGQNKTAAQLYERLDPKQYPGLRIAMLHNGLTPEGPDLGSTNFVTVRAPKVLMLTGDGVTPLDAGEIWHLLDTRYGMAPTLVENDRFANLNISKYNVLILPDGSYNTSITEKVREFASNGGTVIATGAALRWLRNVSLTSIELRNVPTPTDNKPKRRPYGGLTEDFGARALPGAIFEAELDLTHPICYGYSRARMPVFLGEALFAEPTQNPYATPLVFTEQPLLAGYMHSTQRTAASGAGAVLVHGLGRGRVISFPINPAFRSFWLGSNRLLANAIFFGNLIKGDALDRRK